VLAAFCSCCLLPPCRPLALRDVLPTMEVHVIETGATCGTIHYLLSPGGERWGLR